MEVPAGGKGAPAKKAPAPAKADPKKGGSLEEITDNRPRQISFTKDFSLDVGGGAIRITEELAKRFSEYSMKVDIIEVNRENLEEKLKESIKIDMSCFLYTNGKTKTKGEIKPEFSWTFDKLKTLQIHYLTINITSDQPLLSDYLRKKLNPL